MSNVLVTGGAGFIGSHLVDSLLEQNHQVTVIDNLSSGKNLNNQALYYIRDINEDLTDVFEDHKFDCVFHLAAQINLRHSLTHPKQDAKDNILGSLNIIEHCVHYNVKKIFFSSTGGAIYSPEAKLPWSEGSFADPQSPYGLAKLTVENYLRLAESLYNIDYTILRLANVFGPRQNSKGEAGVVSIFLDNIISGKNLTIFGDGNQTRDFIYVKDVVSAFLHVFDNNLTGIFNVSSGEEISIIAVAGKLISMASLFGTTSVQYKDPIHGELYQSCLSNQKLKMSGWNQKYTLNQAISEYITGHSGFADVLDPVI